MMDVLFDRRKHALTVIGSSIVEYLENRLECADLVKKAESLCISEDELREELDRYAS
jgi:hypothetical protein